MLTQQSIQLFIPLNLTFNALEIYKPFSVLMLCINISCHISLDCEYQKRKTKQSNDADKFNLKVAC